MSGRLMFLLILFLSAPITAAPQFIPLDNLPEDRREDAIERMAVVGNSDAVAGLSQALEREEKKDLRVAIVTALGRIRDRGALPALSNALATDFEKDVRLRAIDSILRLYILVEDPGVIRSVFRSVRNVFTGRDRPVIVAGTVVDAEAKDALLNAVLRDFDAEVRENAAHGLGSLMAGDRLDGMIEALTGPRNRESEDVRVALVQSMGIMRNPAAGPALVAALSDPEDKVVEEAILAIGMIGYRDAFPELRAVRQTSRDRDIRRRALEAIALLREPEAERLLVSLLTSSDNHTREFAAEGLARLPYDASGFRDRLTSEREQGVRIAMRFALVTSGDLDSLQEIVEALDSRRDYQAEVYLYEIGRFEGKLANLYPFLQSRNDSVREKLVKVIGNVGDPAAIEQVRQMTRDSDAEVSREAVDALRKLTIASGAR